MKYSSLIALAALLVAGCTSGPPRAQTNATLERYVGYIGEPIDRFTAWRLDSWESISRDQLVLRAGVNEAYLVTVWDTCPDLNFANRIRVVSWGSTISRFDKVRVGRDTCPIREIRPIDVKQMKADLAADKKSGLGPQ